MNTQPGEISKWKMHLSSSFYITERHVILIRAHVAMLGCLPLVFKTCEKGSDDKQTAKRFNKSCHVIAIRSIRSV